MSGWDRVEAMATEGVAMHERSSKRRTTVRLPLPSLTRQFVWFALLTISIALNVVGVLTSGLVYLIPVVAGVFGWWSVQRGYRRTINERNQVREANIDRVDDWIIASTLPEPSAELAELLARVYGEPTWVPPDREGYKGKPGSWRKGDTPPDPNSKRSRKKLEKAKARQVRRLRNELEEKMIAINAVPPMILGESATVTPSFDPFKREWHHLYPCPCADCAEPFPD